MSHSSPAFLKFGAISILLAAAGWSHPVESHAGGRGRPATGQGSFERTLPISLNTSESLRIGRAVKRAESGILRISRVGLPEGCVDCELNDPGFDPEALEAAEVNGLRIGSNGMIPKSSSETPRVKHQLSSRFTGSSYSTGKPVGIIFHKTAGRTCGKNASIGEDYRRPHVYICRDGTIIQNGSFDRPRNGAERGHNDWSINIEFEASYSSQSCRKPEGGGHCYESLTPAQLAWGRAMTRALSQRYQIPIQPALRASSAAQYYDADTYLTTATPRSSNSKRGSDARGILPSFWTRLDYHDDSNHDDGPTFEEFQALLRSESV